MSKRAMQRVTAKSRHQSLLDYSKCEFFVGHSAEAAAILNEAILQFPEEWKLQLERIQQLVTLSACGET